MKKVLKIVGMIIGSIILLLLIAAAFINFSDVPTYEVNAPDLKVVIDSASVAEGRRMAQATCFQCHLSEGKLEGQIMEGPESPFGIIWASNITQDMRSGIGEYTDGELAYLFRTGIKRNGEYTPPWMPKFPHLSDKDLNNIIAYLRSDHEEVQASDKTYPPNKPSLLLKILLRTAFKPLDYDGQPRQAPAISDKVAYGRYLATAKLDCYGCHSPDFTKQNILEPEKTFGYFTGGNPFEDEEEKGLTVYSANLTPDKETGIGHWTEEQFIQAVKFAKKPDGVNTRRPMQPYSMLTDEEVSAIWAYLQTLPPVNNDIKLAGK